ncbi:MAG: DoxX family protein [Chitinophagales bacterium]
MQKRNRIIYWIATVWLCLGMVSTGSAQLRHVQKGPGATEMMTHLGYPVYMLTMLGLLKVAAAVALLIPRFPLIKEWAYAGCFFLMFGAIWSHIAVGDTVAELIPALLLIVLTIVSWYFRPTNRKLVSPV